MRLELKGRHPIIMLVAVLLMTGLSGCTGEIAAVTGPFDPDHMAQTYQTWAELIEPYAAQDVGEEAFDAAVQQLIEHAYQRADAVQEFLSTSRGASTQ